MTTLIGTNPDQIPVNSMLGGMAYQDPDSINVKDFNSSGTANIASLVSPSASITNLSYSGTLTGGTGVINIGSNQIYKDASGNIGLGAVPISNGKTLALVNTTTNPSSFYLQNSTTGFTATDGTLLQLSGSASYLWNFENSTLSLATNNTEYVRLTSTGDLLNLGTGATKLQEGTTAQRPASPQEGMIRKNSTLGVIEGYSGGGYVSLENTLIGVTTLTALVGQDLTFTPNLKTSYMVVEMIGGGGGGGNMITATLTTGNVSIGESGTPGCAVRFLIKKENLQSTYYYRLGTAGASGFSSGQSGSPGGSTIFSQEPTSGTLSNAFTAAGGNGGVGGTEVTPPVTYLNLGTPALSIVGTASNWVILEDGQAYQGERITCVNVNLTSMRSSPEFNQNWWVRHPMTCFGVRGAGGRGGEKRQMTGGASSKSAEAGYTGMIRIYEYS